MKPFPLGPAPCVCPVKAAELDVLAPWEKLVGVVEKQIKDSDKCSFPA